MKPISAPFRSLGRGLLFGTSLLFLCLADPLADLQVSFAQDEPRAARAARTRERLKKAREAREARRAEASKRRAERDDKKLPPLPARPPAVRDKPPASPSTGTAARQRNSGSSRRGSNLECVVGVIGWRSPW